MRPLLLPLSNSSSLSRRAAIALAAAVMPVSVASIHAQAASMPISQETNNRVEMGMSYETYKNTFCVLILDDEGKVWRQAEGKPQGCDSATTPASTFKVALAVMGYDSGILKDAHNPVYDYKQGDADWGGANWTRPVDPQHWMKYSVVWYSQRITHQLGETALHDYAQKMGYGNADFSGDAGYNNGLERAWIISSLKITPREQAQFLYNLVKDQLPVSQEAQHQARALVEHSATFNGWEVYGKTGMAYPRNQDRSFDEEHPYGWYVGWAQKGEARHVFVALRQDDHKMEGSASTRAKETVLQVLEKQLTQ